MTGRVVIPVVLAMMMPSDCGARTSPAEAASAHCAGLARAVDSAPAGSGSADRPAFVASYRPGSGEQALPRELATSAFVYDNALAAIALVACGEVTRARRIGDAMMIAFRSDRTFRDGRLRNAYRAGVIAEASPALPGWWDPTANLWAEDAYQDGSATGNVAWAALALLTLSEATRNDDYLAGAGRLVDWIAATTTRDGDGFSGGFFGFDHQQTPLRWASTEHNVDVAAAAAWLFRRTGEARYADIAAHARRFVANAFQPSDGHFLLGTQPDGAPSRAGIALDVQLWPWMAIADAPADWRRALAFAQQHLAVPGGFDFNDDRDGVWVEGTAQAALGYRFLHDDARADQLLEAMAADRTPSGLLNATRVDRLTTGLSIGPDSPQPDFFYFRRPHLAPTAWACFAALGWNPFAGRHVD